MNEQNDTARAGRPAPILGLLQTAGGSPEPLLHTIRAVRPRVVVLVGSEAALPTIVALTRALQGESADHPLPEFKTLLVKDEADLVACHRAASEGLSLLRHDYGLTRESIRIDFTGGTKAMSAAAVLAAAPEGYQFAYVSGSRRDKEGVGSVVTGSEALCLSENPWTVLEEPELRRLLDMAASGQWAAALASADTLLGRSTEASRPVFQTLRRLLEGLRHWDRFEHQPAWRAWEKGATPGKLADLATASQRSLILGLARKCHTMAGTLGPLANPPETKADLPENKAGQPKRKVPWPDPLVLDMLSNGDRQAGRGQWDEAALRYYRALELAAERRLKFALGIDNSAVREGDVPQPLRDEFLRRKDKPSPVWKLAQYESVQLLAAGDDRLGKRLLEAMDSNKLDSQARNEKWLIHGTQHVDQPRFLAFKRNVLDALDIAEKEVFAWPDFRAEGRAT